MFNAAIDALTQILSPSFRTILWKILAITFALLCFVWVGLNHLISTYIQVPLPWLALALSVLTGFGLFAGMGFLVAPTSSLVAGLYLDDVAEHVERDLAAPDGRALPNGQAIFLALRFTGMSIVVNLVALLFLFVPFVNIFAFFVANAYLMSREYFALAALRYASMADVKRMRQQHNWYLFGCGLMMALFVAVPVLNLLTPLFATAFMVHIHNRLAGFKRIDVIPPQRQTL
jgi:CysZ protein